MSAPAVMMMLLAITILWGGLALAILNLLRYPGEEPDQVRRDL
jgi:hypothetical protein